MPQIWPKMKKSGPDTRSLKILTLFQVMNSLIFYDESGKISLKFIIACKMDDRNKFGGHA